MNKILLLLITSLSYGQSFFDTSIAGGISKEQTPFGGIELRYNQKVFKEIYGSTSINFLLETDRQGVIDIKLYPRIGGTIRLPNKMSITGGASIEVNNIGFWPEPYLRVDQEVWSNDQGSIGGIIDAQMDRVMVGIVFKNR